MQLQIEKEKYWKKKMINREIKNFTCLITMAFAPEF